MLKYFFPLMLLSICCVHFSEDVYSQPPKKSLSTQKAPPNKGLKDQIRKLKGEVATLKRDIATLFALIRKMRPVLPKKPIQIFPKVKRNLGTYYAQWHKRGETVLPPTFHKQRSPFINNWAASGVKFSFTKKSSTSILKITYNDNMRTMHAKRDTACTFSIFIDQKPCAKPTPIEGSVYIRKPAPHNPHRQRSIIGVCRAVGWTKELSTPIKKGRHEVRIYVRSPPGYSGAKCFLGWYSSTLLMVEEIETKK